MKVILEVGREDILELVKDANEHEIRFILMDALAEFQSNRGPSSEAYVNRRYPDDKVYAGVARERKIKQVERRKIIAELLRCSIITLID